jgi:dCTP deaminase
MILKADRLVKRLSPDVPAKEGIVIAPRPDLDAIAQSGAASIDLRLGCWFLTLRQTRVPLLDIYESRERVPSEAKLAKTHYVPLGEHFILHPRGFVLGVTLEWISLPGDLAGYVVGRSSWGRRGLIIATATGVHPGFTGCLTLELTNVGEIPISLQPGTTVCQLFVHTVDTDSHEVDASAFVGRRRPILGHIEPDETARRLSRGLE